MALIRRLRNKKLRKDEKYNNEKKKMQQAKTSKSQHIASKTHNRGSKLKKKYGKTQMAKLHNTIREKRKKKMLLRKL